MTGITGPLIPAAFLSGPLFAAFGGRLGEAEAPRALARLRAWWRPLPRELGPSSSLRAVVGRGAVPLARILGFDTGAVRYDAADRLAWLPLRAGTSPTAIVPMLVAPWAADLGHAWRRVTQAALVASSRWTLCFNGCAIRMADGWRPFVRRFVEFDLSLTLEDNEAGRAMWGLLRAGTLAPAGIDRMPSHRSRGTSARSRDAPPLVDAIVAAAEASTASTCGALRVGVRDALEELLDTLVPRRASPALANAALGQALTFVYRVLFLLFAEARGLVPMWHPLYRRHYSVESLRDAIDRAGEGASLWPALQAIARLAHDGCRMGDLRVTGFNGDLFSPSHAPIVERAHVSPRRAREVLLSLTTTPGRGGAPRQRIAFGDLGVEQLGAVYEEVLDYDPVRTPQLTPRSRAAPGAPAIHRRRRVTLDRSGSRRKRSGTFYTPRPLTEFLVRRTLAPLVRDAAPDEVLAIKVLDPAAGSGAFLVAACRFLAAAYETALVRAGDLQAGQASSGDRAGFRRLVAQRCLYGVDLNPTATQLARLSLWLVSLAAGCPLTFLDHHLRVGDSLVGASPVDLARQLPAVAGIRSAAQRPLPLLDPLDASAALGAVVPVREWIARSPERSVDDVRAKSRALDETGAAGGTLARLKSAADLWCATWFWPADRPRLTAGMYSALLDALLKRETTLPSDLAAQLAGTSAEVARRQRFFHWTLEFPEAFVDASGVPLPRPGFHAIVGNPPWEMLRRDPDRCGDGSGRGDGNRNASVVRFARESGQYRARGSGHVNLFQLFVERALSLVAPEGRIGLVLPWSFAADAGCGQLRERVWSAADVDTMCSVENRRGLFDVHRSLRLLLLTATAGRPTREIRCRLGERDATGLDRLGDESNPDEAQVVLTRAFLTRVSGRLASVPDARSAEDLRLVEKLTATCPRLDDSPWAVTFGRELNATDDRALIRPRPPGLLVIEGKHLRPFGIRRDSLSTHPAFVRPDSIPSTWRRPRIACRDITSPTNQLSLIAAIVPSTMVTSHTVFCSKGALPALTRWWLCAVLNSLVANYFARLWVSSHVTASLIARLPLPPVGASDRCVREIAGLAARLARTDDAIASPLYVRLQAAIARAYGLTASELAHVLSSFPLVPRQVVEEIRSAFEAQFASAPADVRSATQQVPNG